MLGLALLASVTACGGKPNPQDVAAARACEAFSNYVDAVGNHQSSSTLRQAALDKATVLTNGSADAQQQGRPLPKWAGLGADLVELIGDVNTQDTTAEQADAPKVANACGKIPSAAKRAGGYVKKS